MRRIFLFEPVPNEIFNRKFQREISEETIEEKKRPAERNASKKKNVHVQRINTAMT